MYNKKPIALTKTRYQLGARCQLALHKELLWTEVKRVKEELRTESQWEIFHTKALSEMSLAEKEGIEIGKMIYKHPKFKNGILISSLHDQKISVDQTKRILSSNEHSFIFEATFHVELMNPNGLGNMMPAYIRADIVEVNKNGTLNIYEAKSSSNSEMKKVQIEDITYQKFVIESLGYKVEKCFLANLNKDYEKNGDIDVEQLFAIQDVSELVEREQAENLEKKLADCAEMMQVYAPVPTKAIGSHCKKGHECPFYEDCLKNIKDDSIHKISQIRQNARDLLTEYEKNSMHDIDLNPSEDDVAGHSILRMLNTRQQRQIENKQTKKNYLNKDIIEAFLTGDLKKVQESDNIDYMLVYKSKYEACEKIIKDIMKNIIVSNYKITNEYHENETEHNEEYNKSVVESLSQYSYDEFRMKVLEADFSEALLTRLFRVRAKPYAAFRNSYLGDFITELTRQKMQDMFKGLKYPLNHLDFEGRNFAVPRYDGMKCYEVYTYQASIHLEEKDGDLSHTDFLATKNQDQRRELCSYLIKELSKNDGSIIVYYKAYEIGRLKDLQRWFPEYKTVLQGFIDRIVDLDEITKRTWFYTEDFNGSHSIKYVAPYFNPSLSYKGMEVSNGFESMEKWQEFIESEMQTEKKETREKALRVYCKKDTFAMVTLINGLLALAELDHNIFEKDV